MWGRKKSSLKLFLNGLIYRIRDIWSFPRPTIIFSIEQMAKVYFDRSQNSHLNKIFITCVCDEPFSGYEVTNIPKFLSFSPKSFLSHRFRFKYKSSGNGSIYDIFPVLKYIGWPGNRKNRLSIVFPLIFSDSLGEVR